MHAHAWKMSEDPKDLNTEVCTRDGCTVRRYLPGRMWQRKPRGHWRSMSTDPIPSCTGGTKEVRK